MNILFKKLLPVVLLTASYILYATNSCCDIDCCISPYYSIRSQSVNAARELVGAGWNTQINLCCCDRLYGNFSITPEYSRSFRAGTICECLFGCNSSGCGPCNGCCDISQATCCNPCRRCCDDNGCCIRVSGSMVENRSAYDWLADYFGLPTDYKSIVTFEPRIDNFLVDFSFYFGFDQWISGLYLKVHAPIVHTRWDLTMCECVEDAGKNPHWSGYFNKSLTEMSTGTYGIARNHLVSSFTSFMNGCGIINDPTLVFNPLCRAKIDCCRRAETALSDIQVALGWNFICNEGYHLGCNIRGSIPTGTRPNGCYLFEPIIGNGRHWEAGGGISGHWTFWESGDEEQSGAFYVDAHITHLFKAKQCRTFDVRCKPLSRYMLAVKHKEPVEDLQAGQEVGKLTKPNKQIMPVFSPVANLTTIPVDVSVGVQADVVLMFQYVHNNWGFDLGYNLWAKTCETIDYNCDCCPSPFEEETWALKGDAFIYGYKDDADNTSVPLSISQSQATIHKGTNGTPGKVDNIHYWRNPGVDNRQLAWDALDKELYTFKPDGLDDQVYTSKNPIFITYGDIDICSARTKGLSHKLFGHFDYTWLDREDWIPYLGIGGEIEFGVSCCDDSCSNNCNPCNTQFCNPCGTPCNPCAPCDSLCCSMSCDSNNRKKSSCNSCAVSQWGIWLKGGVGF